MAPSKLCQTSCMHELMYGQHVCALEVPVLLIHFASTVVYLFCGLHRDAIPCKPFWIAWQNPSLSRFPPAMFGMGCCLLHRIVNNKGRPQGGLILNTQKSVHIHTRVDHSQTCTSHSQGDSTNHRVDDFFVPDFCLPPRDPLS